MGMLLDEWRPGPHERRFRELGVQAVLRTHPVWSLARSLMRWKGIPSCPGSASHPRRDVGAPAADPRVSNDTIGDPHVPVAYESRKGARNLEHTGGSVVGPRGLEPRTSSLSGMRSNRAELWAPVSSARTRGLTRRGPVMIALRPGGDPARPAEGVLSGGSPVCGTARAGGSRCRWRCTRRPCPPPSAAPSSACSGRADP
jgi:hypothetical protein